MFKPSTGSIGGQQVALVVDLGGPKAYGVVIAMSGRILHETETQFSMNDAEETYNGVVRMLDQLQGEAKRQEHTVKGIGLSIPGITHPDEGTVEKAAALKWEKFPVKKRLEDHFKLPVMMENDVNLAALGEVWFGGFKKTRNLVMITITAGIGSGIIINSMIYRGLHNMAGEIGYLFPDRASLDQRYPGFGPMEQLASATGILARAKEELQKAKPGAPYQTLTLDDLFKAAKGGEDWAKKVVTDTVDYLAMLAGAVAVCYDPDVVLFTGVAAQYPDLLIAPLKARLEGVIPYVPLIEACHLGKQGAVLGAIVELMSMQVKK